MDTLQSKRVLPMPDTYTSESPENIEEFTSQIHNFNHKYQCSLEAADFKQYLNGSIWECAVLRCCKMNMGAAPHSFMA